MKTASFKITVYITLLYFLLYYYRSALPYIEYKINQTYIEENLCENKDKPWMHCHGKCYLKKQIKKAEKNERKQNPLTISDNSFLFFVKKITSEKLFGISDLSQFLKYIKKYSFLYIRKIFKPPKTFFS